METITLASPKELKHNKYGFETLIRLLTPQDTSMPANIVVDLQKTEWLDADMCAPLGGMVCLMEQRLNRVEFINAGGKLKNILMRNNFLYHHGGEKISDPYDTVIAYQKFNVDDDRRFSHYTVNELKQHKIFETHIPLRKALNINIAEIFINSAQHSDTRVGIFSCGQFYPKRNKLVFSVADMGIGMRKKICHFLQKDISAIEAIKWAVEGNTTKRGGKVPGGLGLKRLVEFVDSNKGCVRIVSDDGYWEKRDGRVSFNSIVSPFPGTVVTLEASASG